ncbi:MAG: PKD domain-containing protein, partial [Flavihumibacter sp.]
RLILNDTNFCNAGDSSMQPYNVSPLVKADFTIEDGCAPYTAIITNNSIAGDTWLWDFGDGTTSTDKNPVKVYNVPGTYTVSLTVTDPNTCNVTDRTFRQVLIQLKPTAAFTPSPTIPVTNTPHHFSNGSSADAVRFIWEFGDGDSLSTSSRAEITHQFNESGQYEVCLQAINQAGCIDTSCQTVEAIVSPQIDLPNAFTPTGPAPNNIVFVKGFGIKTMRFLVFNRLGQKIFESNSLKFGWDGKVNGVVQPMDVYAYVLDVQFVDGTRATKKGDITLIR